MQARRTPRVRRRAWSASECVRCKTLRQENEALRQQIARLRENLMEAHRAGKRQAAPFSKGPPKMAPKRPGRKPGKDYGVKARRAVPASIDEVYTVPLPPGCPYCGGDVVETHTAAQYQEDIPPVKPLIRRFDVHLGRCVQCKRPVRGRHPLQTSNALGAAGIHIGPRALALAADLNKRIGTPFGKVSTVFRTAFSLSISRGGLSLALTVLPWPSPPPTTHWSSRSRSPPSSPPTKPAGRSAGACSTNYSNASGRTLERNAKQIQKMINDK